MSVLQLNFQDAGKYLWTAVGKSFFVNRESVDVVKIFNRLEITHLESYTSVRSNQYPGPEPNDSVKQYARCFELIRS